MSCGGQMYQQTQAGKPVLIVTLMGGQPSDGPTSTFAQSLHQRWELAMDTVAERRFEDTKACELVGADYIHWDVPDCIYRRDPLNGMPLYASEQALFGQVHPADASVLDFLVQSLAKLPDHREILVPLGAGNHVDHQITRQAAEKWLNPARLTYYEEYPYAREEGAMGHILASENEWQPQVISLTRQAIEIKVKAIACYRSQISTFFADLDDMAEQVIAHGRRIGGERVWRRHRKRRVL